MRRAPECGCETGGKIVRGMCVPHYDHWLRVTPPEERGAPPRLARQFGDFVDKGGDCWLWTGTTNRRGYGWWSGNGERGLAHRISLATASPPSSPALMACHTCDNPPCVNPAHLYWGTAKDNARDVMERQGVHNKGEFASVCKHGHPMEGTNLRIVGKNRKRQCRECDNTRSRERQRRYRAERMAS